MDLINKKSIKEKIEQYMIKLPIEERENGYIEVLYLYRKEIKQISDKIRLEAAYSGEKQSSSILTPNFCYEILSSLLDKFLEARILAITPRPMNTDEKIIYTKRKTINYPIHYGNLLEFPKNNEQLVMFSKIFENSIFSSLTPRQRRKFIRCLVPLETHPNEIIIRKGEDGSKLFFLETGTFCLLLDKEEFEKEKYKLEIRPFHHIIYENKPMVEIELPLHTVTGEIALLHGIPRTATIISKSNGHVWFLKRSFYYTIRLHDEQLKWTCFTTTMENKGFNKKFIHKAFGTFFYPDTTVRLSQCPSCHKFTHDCCSFSKRCRNFPSRATHMFFSSFEAEISVNGQSIILRQYELVSSHFTALSEMEGYILPII